MLLSIIRDASARVFSQLGSGHSEKIYHKALHCELISLGFNITSEYHVPITYKDSKNNKHILESERIDILIHSHNDYKEIENKNVILELKSISKNIQEQEKNQVFKYIKSLCNLEFAYGIVINFPQPSNKEIKDKIDFCVVFPEPEELNII
jgi:GxxExxY protein